MGKFFADLLSKAASRLGDNFNDDPASKEGQSLTTSAYKLKAKHYAGSCTTTVSPSGEESKDYQSSFGFENRLGDGSLSLSPSECKLSQGVELYDEKDVEVKAEVAWTCMYSAGSAKEVNLEVETPKVAGMQAFLNLGFESKSERDAAGPENSAHGALNLHCPSADLDVGVSGDLDGDLNNKQFQAVYSGLPNKTAWLRADMNMKFLGLGMYHGKKSGYDHAWELVYCFGAENKAAGLWGTPCFYRYGSKYKINDKVKMTCDIRRGQNYYYNHQFDYKLDHNWSLALHQHFDGSRNAHNFGWGLSYKL